MKKRLLKLQIWSAINHPHCRLPEAGWYLWNARSISQRLTQHCLANPDIGRNYMELAEMLIAQSEGCSDAKNLKHLR
jgi:hypothetical protein